MNRRRYLTASSLAVAGVSGLAGCFDALSLGEGTAQRVADDWQPGPGEWGVWPGYGPRMNRYNPHASPPRSEPSVDWSHDSRGPNSHPWLAIADETVYTRTDAGLVAWDTDDGTEVWRHTSEEFGWIIYIDGRVYQSPQDAGKAMTLDGETLWPLEDASIIVGETAGHVYTETRSGIGWHDPETGGQRGTIDTDARPAMVTDGRVFVKGDTGIAVYAQEDGGLTQQWRHQITDGYRPYGGFTLANDRVYVRAGGDAGERLETYSLDGDRLASEPWDNHQIKAVIGVDGSEYLFVTEFDSPGGEPSASHLIAREGRETELWRKSFSPSSPVPVVAPDTIIASDGDKLIGLDRDTGEQLWALNGQGGQVAIVEDSIYVNFRQLSALRT